MNAFICRQTIAVCLACMFGFAGAARAQTNFFVAPPGAPGVTPVWPHTNWNGAATDLVALAMAASAGDTITVSNGIYQLTNEAVFTGVTITSLNGAANTILTRADGTTNRIVRARGSMVDGFTITNGIAFNDGDYPGAGAYLDAAGGIWLNVSTARNCVIVGNIASNGGGVMLLDNSAVYNSLIAGNSAISNGGGVAFGPGGKHLMNCTIVDNTAPGGAGGGIGLLPELGVAGLTLNSIVYSNSAGTFDNSITNDMVFTNCCISPTNDLVGSGNMDDEPQFVDYTAGNFRVCGLSPCIDAGLDQAWMAGAFDLDGGLRVCYNAVDIGCYEYPDLFTIPLSPTGMVVEGGTTNGSLVLRMGGPNADYNENMLWTVSKTNQWLTFGPTTGEIPAGGEDALAWTNSAVTLAPQRYQGNLAFCISNAHGVSTSMVTMTLDVMGIRASPALVTNAVMMNFNAPTRTVAVWNAGAGAMGWTVEVSSSATNWLAVTPASGVSTGQTAAATNLLSLTFASSNLALGEYFGQVWARADAGGAARVVDVQLRVNEPGGIAVAPVLFERDVRAGRALESDTLSLTNISGIYPAHYGARVTAGTEWLSVSGNTNGTLTPGGMVALSVDYDTINLPEGQYSGTILITNAASDLATGDLAVGAPREVPVLLRVNPRPELSVSVNAISNIVSEGRDAATKIFQVWNGSGYYTLTYQISDNVPWVIPGVSGGTSTGEHDLINLYYSTAGLEAGNYTGRVTVTTSDQVTGADTRYIDLYLEVTGVAGLGCNGAEQDYVLRLGDDPVASGFNVWNTSRGAGAAMRWSAAISSLQSSSLPFCVSPSGGLLAPGATQSVVLTCDPSGLVPGRYEALLRITGEDVLTGGPATGSPYDIRVAVWLRAGDGLHFGGASGSALVVYGLESGDWGMRDLDGAFAWDWLGAHGYIPVPGDYNGDGMAELGVYRPVSGNWYWKDFMGDGRIMMLGNFGGTDWSPVRGDYDGDGRQDFVLYNETTGEWYALLSGSNYQPAGVVLGGSGCLPVRGDFDGDGKADPGVYNESTGEWRGLLSAQNYRQIGGVFGGPGFSGMAGDFDGDGISELCLYHTNGRWYVMGVDGRVLLWGDWWGGTNWQALIGDYDGDGCDDLAIYDPTSGNWRIRRMDGAILAWDVTWGGYSWQAVGR